MLLRLLQLFLLLVLMVVPQNDSEGADDFDFKGVAEGKRSGGDAGGGCDSSYDYGQRNDGDGGEEIVVVVWVEVVVSIMAVVLLMAMREKPNKQTRCPSFLHHHSCQNGDGRLRRASKGGGGKWESRSAGDVELEGEYKSLGKE